MRRNAAGFTLIELLATLAVLAIVGGVGAPAFRSLVTRMSAMSVASDLTSSLASARMNAIAKGGITICPSADGQACNEGTDWSQGWIAFRARSTDRGPRTLHDLVSVHGPLPNGVRVVASSGRTRVHYLPTGFASGTNVTLSICMGRDRLEKVVMNNAGRVRTERDAAPCPSP